MKKHSLIFPIFKWSLVLICCWLCMQSYAHTSCCLTNSLIINTGYDPTTGLAVPPNCDGCSPVADPKWTVCFISPNLLTAIADGGFTSSHSSADIIVGDGAWTAPCPQSEWIGCFNSHVLHDGTAGMYFEVCRTFTLVCPACISYNFNIADDNWISSMTLTGGAIPGSTPIPIFSQTYSDLNYQLFSNASTSASGCINLDPGTYTITVTVNEDGYLDNAMGVDICGTITTPTAALLSESTGCTASNTFCTEPSFTGYPLCVGSTETFTDAETGGTWSSSLPGVATIDASTGLATGNSPGITIITYTDNCGRQVFYTLMVNPSPAIITGDMTVCVGSTTTLADATGGGTWNSSSAIIAGVDESTGIVTSVSPGLVTITYTLPAGCFTTTNVTVNPTPVFSPTANSPCVGNSLILNSNVTTGCSGTCACTYNWMPGGLTDATESIPTTTTMIGTTDYILTVTNCFGCSSTQIIPVTVNPVPSYITGTMDICAGSITDLSDAPGGGTWSSSDFTVATVDEETGIVSGESAGITTISYIFSTSCYATTNVTINPTPVFSPTANSPCVGNSLILNSNVTSGCSSTCACIYSWMPGSMTDATEIIPTTTAMTGTTDYTLKITNCFGCASIQTSPVTVFDPIAGTISGPSEGCAFSTYSFTDIGSSATGTWTITGHLFGSNINPTTGVLTTGNPPCPETITVSYTVMGGAAGSPCESVATQTITIYPSPTATAYTASSCRSTVCPGIDVPVRICGTSGATVSYSYLWPGPGTTTVYGSIILPTAPCPEKACTTIYIPPPPPVDQNDGLFTFNLLNATLGPCPGTLHTVLNLAVAEPTATLSLIGPPPCLGQDYCILITGTPGATVYVGEYLGFDPTVFTPLSPTPFVLSSAGTDTICGLVLPPPGMPVGFSAGQNTFCIAKIVGCDGCTVTASEGSPLPCLNVIGRALPDLQLMADGPFCLGSSFPLVLDILSGPGIVTNPGTIQWSSSCSGWTETSSPTSTTWITESYTLTEDAITVYPPATSPLPCTYEVTVTGDNGCQSTASVTVTESAMAEETLTATTPLCMGVFGDEVINVTGTASTDAIYSIEPEGYSGLSPFLPLGTGTFDIDFTPYSTIENLIISEIWGLGLCPNYGPFAPIPIPIYSVPPITGETYICGPDAISPSVSTSLLSDAEAGGSWSSGNPAVATIDPTGLVIGLTPGTTVITYAIPESCSVTTTVTVVGNPGACVAIEELCTEDPSVGNVYIFTGPRFATVYFYSYSGIYATPPCGTADMCSVTLDETGHYYLAYYLTGAAATSISFCSPATSLPCLSLIDVYLSVVDLCSVYVPNPDGTSGCMFPATCMSGGARMSGNSNGGNSANGNGVKNIVQNIVSGFENLSIMPNPNNGTFTISGAITNTTNSKDVKLEVVDLLGQTILTDVAAIDNGGISKTITLGDNIANGVYLIKVNNEDGMQTLRFTLSR